MAKPSDGEQRRQHRPGGTGRGRHGQQVPSARRARGKGPMPKPGSGAIGLTQGRRHVQTRSSSFIPGAWPKRSSTTRKASISGEPAIPRRLATPSDTLWVPAAITSGCTWPWARSHFGNSKIRPCARAFWLRGRAWQQGSAAGLLGAVAPRAGGEPAVFRGDRRSCGVASRAWKAQGRRTV